MRLKTTTKMIVESRLNDYDVVDTNNNWFAGGKEEISTREIWPKTKNIGMRLFGIKKPNMKYKTTISPDIIVPNQTGVIKNSVEEYMSKLSSELPKVVLYNGYAYISEGHHRLAAETINGNKDIKVEAFYFIDTPKGPVQIAKPK